MHLIAYLLLCGISAAALCWLWHAGVRARQASEDALEETRRDALRRAVRYRRRHETRLEFDEFGRQKCKPPDGAGE